MTRSLLASLAFTAFVFVAGCQRHPVSQSGPADSQMLAAQKAAEEKKAHTPIAINPEAPKFFPPLSGQ